MRHARSVHYDQIRSRAYYKLREHPSATDLLTCVIPSQYRSPENSSGLGHPGKTNRLAHRENLAWMNRFLLPLLKQHPSEKRWPCEGHTDDYRADSDAWS